MSEQERAQALSELLDAALRGEDTESLGPDEELRALSDVGRTLSDMSSEPSQAQKAALERMLQAHRADIARAAGAEQQVARPRASIGELASQLGNWLSGRRLPVAVGALVVMLIIALLAIFGLPGQNGEEIIAKVPSPTVMVVPTEMATATATPGEVTRPTREPTALPSATPLTPPTPQPTLSPTPSATPIIMPPNAVVLHRVQGVVEVQTAAGTWVPAEVQPFVREGERIRTGALSGVEMAFYDGSVVRMGAETQITVDRLKPGAGGARVIELTQWLGESDHDVAQAKDAYGWYVVRTPSGVGTTVGTAFQVRVTPALVTWFSVDEGAVRVSNAGVSVVAIAGQVTLSHVAEAPERPVFRVRGEGQVTETGRVWRIAGQAFATHGETVLVGSPQVGDWVSVEGHVDGRGTRYADRIVLLRRSPVEHFSLVAQVGAIAEDAWTIGGQRVAIVPETDIEDGLEVGDLVCGEGTIQEDGTLVAAQILYRGDAAIGEPFSYVGVVQAMSTEVWLISDVPVAVNEATLTDEDLLPGSVVLVRGDVLDDGTWLARSIRRIRTQVRTFEFVGKVERVDPWMVAGIELEMRLYTVIDEGIGEDDQVRVQGIILDDGTWVVETIKWVDQDGPAFAFVGTVEQTDPTWRVRGVELVVHDGTEIDEGVGVGSLVRVEGTVSAEQGWVADRIAAVSEAQRGAGCIREYSVVTSVNAKQIVLLNGVTLPRGGVTVENGTLERGAVVEVWVCTDSTGTVYVVSITVVGHVDVDTLEKPTIEPSPTPRPETTEGDEPTSPKVTVCHNGQTIEISKDALDAHLAIGDTFGPCGKTQERDTGKPPKPDKPDKGK